MFVKAFQLNAVLGHLDGGALLSANASRGPPGVSDLVFDLQYLSTIPSDVQHISVYIENVQYIL